MNSPWKKIGMKKFALSTDMVLQLIADRIPESKNLRRQGFNVLFKWKGNEYKVSDSLETEVREDMKGAFKKTSALAQEIKAIIYGHYPVND